MMKSIYGKLICGFLITIVFSFSVAGYVALRSNYDQIEDMAKNELNATSEYVAGILNILEDANVSNTLKLILRFFHLIMAIINMEMVQPSHQKKPCKNIIMMSVKMVIIIKKIVFNHMEKKLISKIKMFICTFKKILAMKKVFLQIQQY